MNRPYGPTEAKAVASERLRGIITAFCLPSARDGTVDEEALRRDVRHCIDVLRVDGLYVNSFYGHYWLLTSDQRRRVLEVVIDEADGAVAIIDRCAHPSPYEAAELARRSQEVGADFISLVVPQFGGAHPDILVGYFEIVARAIDLGITIFNTTQAGYHLTPEMMARLADIPNVCALKNGLDLDHTNRIRALVGERIVVIDPEEEHFMVNLERHGQRAIYTGTNMMFDTARATPMRDYVDAALDGDMVAARATYEAMQPVRDLHHRWVIEPWQRMGLCPVATVKTWTGLVGMSGGPSPEPLPMLEPTEVERLATELGALGMLA